MKPYYSEAGIEIYHGDCRQILPQIGTFDLLLTDIPYGVVNRESNGLRVLDKESADIETIPLECLLPLLASSFTGSAYIWCGTEQVSGIRGFLAEECSTRLGFWEKSNPSPMNGEKLWLSSIECCVYAKRPSATFNNFCASPVWRGPTAEPVGHPTPKPEWLMRHLLLASTVAGQTVLDPFCGSGTTLVAAKDMGLSAAGIEAEERYCEIAANRLRQEVLQFA